MSRVIDLVPGDRVENEMGGAIFVAQTVHPRWPGLQLVIWIMDDGTWHHDALAPAQVVGKVTSRPDDRYYHLAEVFSGGDNYKYKPRKVAH